MRTIDIINTAVELTGISNRDSLPTDMKVTLLDFLNMDYEQIYHSYTWADVKVFSLSVTTLSGFITLPQYVDTVRAARVGDIPIFPIDEIKLNLISPEDFSSTGDAVRFIHELPHAIETQPSTGTTLKFVSTSASDTSVIRVKAVVGGKTEFEDITLTGTTAVASTKTVTEVLQITKAVTVGRITVSLADDTEVGYIQPEATSPKYERLQILRDPGDAVTVTIMCKRRFERLISDYDSPVMDIGFVLVKFLAAMIYLNLSHEPEKGAALKQEGISALQDYFDSQEKAPDKDLVLIPATGVFAEIGNDYSQDLSITGIYSNG